MHSFRFFARLSSLLGLIVIFNTACVRQNFDEPPGEGIVEITPTATIAQLKALHTLGAYEQITEDWTIGAVVVADDASGNYYKTIVIQDATAGIELKVNANSIFNEYPIGRTIYIKVQNLWLGDYNGLVQLGGSTYIDNSGNNRLGGIEDLLRDNYIIRGNYGTAPAPKVVNIADLGPDDMSMLVQINDAQFATADAGQTFADAPNKFSLNRTLEDCNGNSVVVRTSGYSNFASELTPNGKGTLVGIASVFGATLQMTVRDLNDVANMTDTRCDGGGGGGGGGGVSGTLTPIGTVRAQFSGTTTTVSADTKIAGVVISDKDNSNITSKNMIVQGADGKGITIRFASAHSFSMGDAVEIGVSGLELSEFNGQLQVNNVPLANAAAVSGGVMPTPVVVTISQLLADLENYESTLVKINNVTISSTFGPTFSGNATITDAGSSMALYTTSYSTFANSNFPTTQVNLTGIAGQGGNSSSYQISIRNLNDLQ